MCICVYICVYIYIQIYYIYLYAHIYVKYKITNCNQIEFIARMQDWFIVGKSVDVICHSNGIKGKIV